MDATEAPFQRKHSDYLLDVRPLIVMTKIDQNPRAIAQRTAE